jgi:predicted metalloprotease with PDZ domain
MTQYKVSALQPSNHFFSIEAEFETKGKDKLVLQFPRWRPGRYEMANFAKNVRRFRVVGPDHKALTFQKNGAHQWEVDCVVHDKVKVIYQYHAFELNAGSTFLDENQWYINPVNCMVYEFGSENEACSLELALPDAYEIAAGHLFKNNSAQFDSYHQLVDTPFMASKTMKTLSYKVGETPFYLCFQGEFKLDEDRILKDFVAFTKKQLDAFGSFPFESYYFLFQITPYKTYHGVEHLTSTVIALGPSYDLMGDLYTEFLGVSSHELYHAWNVKSIRPMEMYPYKYHEENYSEMGYLCEGVTTYLGDLFLLKSKVFDTTQYLKELTTQLQRHFDNDGRLNYSVSDSSIDTWLDGYSMGIPGRKVSIYTEGCLLSLVLDTTIMRATQNQKSIHDLMRVLYTDYAQKNKGVAPADFKLAAEKLCGHSLDELFDNYYYGTAPYNAMLAEALDYLGLELKVDKNPIKSEAMLGMKTMDNTIYRIADGSPADQGGLSIKDKLVAINGFEINNDLEKWLAYFEGENISITVSRAGQHLDFLMTQSEMDYYRKYSAVVVEESSRSQRAAFNKWSSKKD